MKKLLSLLILAAIFVSCSSDDDDAGVAVEGTWKMTTFRSENAYDLNGNGTISNDIKEQTNCYQNETLVFNSNGTGANVSTSYLDISLELVAGTTNEYEYNVECVNENSTTAFSWVQNGDNVVVTQSGVVLTGIQDGNEITFTVVNGFDIEVEQGGGTATVTEDLTIVYQKQ